jgi:catechol 2,3-dioxygenase-like lactoylglutathione lyase family enzyme
VLGISYVVLRCADLERTREFYEALGLQLVPEQHGSGAKHYSSDVGGVILEFYPFAGKPTSGLQFGLVVPDVGRVIESLRTRWTTVTIDDAGSTAAATIKDPDGHRIELQHARSR